ncbi:hypothetical protein BKM12_16665 [Pseudomonas syringae pv. syringae]|nr:hypothetical protein BKM12_16665 [Pseudomonas syringae pv. syringae]
MLGGMKPAPKSKTPAAVVGAAFSVAHAVDDNHRIAMASLEALRKWFFNDIGKCLVIFMGEHSPPLRGGSYWKNRKWG